MSQFKLVYLQTLYVMILLIIPTIPSGSIVADTVDEGELRTSVRQEGICFAFTPFRIKAASGFCTLFAGLIIAGIDLPPNALPGTVDPSVIWNLGLFAGPILSILWFIPCLIVTQMPLTRERLVEMQTELNSLKAN